jgi:penicillin-binding protein 2
MYEQYLRGIDGEKRVEVDASGREVRVLDIKEPISGHALYLNIDLDVQQAVENGLEGKKGGVVISDPRTGGVLAISSHPAYDPNQLTSGSREYWKTIVSDKNHPLQNRVIQGRFPPGSTFKMVLAMKGLEKGVINETTAFFCPGSFAYGGRVFRCWQRKGHGMISVHRAIVESCDVFFYNLGLRLGVDSIHEMSERIGLTRPTGIDLPGEKSGLVPSTAWKKKTFGEKWYEGETVSVSIGQGAVWLTPIGLMQLAAFVGNEGVTFKPQIVNRVVSPQGKVVKIFEPVMAVKDRIDKRAVQIVKEGMKGVVNEPNGTAYSAAYLPHVAIAGKTGTAQTVRMEKGRGRGDHAWFIAFAPADTPSVAMGILVEHGGHGGSASAPIAKAVAQVLFKEKEPEMKSAQAANANR